MASIADYIKSYIPETERVLVQTAVYGEGGDVKLFDLKTGVVMNQLFVDGTVEASFGTAEFVKDYVAALVVHESIMAAIDYVQTKTDRSVSGPAGVGTGGESVQHYDRVQGLKDIDKRLVLKLKASATDFLVLAAEWLRSGRSQQKPLGMAVSTRATDMKSLDPDDFPAVAGDGFFYEPFANVFVIKEG